MLIDLCILSFTYILCSHEDPYQWSVSAEPDKALCIESVDQFAFSASSQAIQLLFHIFRTPELFLSLTPPPEWGL